MKKYPFFINIQKLKKKLSWDTNYLINSEQNGFISGKSTATNLMLYKIFIIGPFEQRFQVEVLHTDFTKTFDRVNHVLLLIRLMLSWLVS